MCLSVLIRRVSLEQARARALELGSKVALGTDAMKSQQKRQAQITLGQLLEAYLEGHARQHCAAAREIEAVYRRYLTDWMDTRK